MTSSNVTTTYLPTANDAAETFDVAPAPTLGVEKISYVARGELYVRQDEWEDRGPAPATLPPAP